jgi:hypothetical protein
MSSVPSEPNKNELPTGARKDLWRSLQAPAWDTSHEGLEVTDGINRFRIVNGQRVWLSEPPHQQRNELLRQHNAAVKWRAKRQKAATVQKSTEEAR